MQTLQRLPTETVAPQQLNLLACLPLCSFLAALVCNVLQLVQTLQRLPTETVATRQELEQLTSHELKERLAATGISCTGCLERQELIDALLQAGGSSGSSCCICCEDYSSGDVVRVLPCKVSNQATRGGLCLSAPVQLCQLQ